MRRTTSEQGQMQTVRACPQAPRHLLLLRQDAGQRPNARSREEQPRCEQAHGEAAQRDPRSKQRCDVNTEILHIANALMNTLIIVVCLGAQMWFLHRRLDSERNDAEERTRRAMAAVQSGFDQLCAKLGGESSITLSREADGTVVATRDGVLYVRTPHGWRFYEAPFTYLQPGEPAIAGLEQAHAALTQNGAKHTQALTKAREEAAAEENHA